MAPCGPSKYSWGLQGFKNVNTKYGSLHIAKLLECVLRVHPKDTFIMDYSTIRSKRQMPDLIVYASLKIRAYENFVCIGFTHKVQGSSFKYGGLYTVGLERTRLRRTTTKPSRRSQTIYILLFLYVVFTYSQNM